jgi:hypothetical protein
MTTESSAVLDLIRGVHAGRLQTTPGDDMLFTPRPGSRRPSAAARKPAVWTAPAVQKQPRPSVPEMPRQSRIWVWIGTLLAVAVIGSMAAVAAGVFAQDQGSVPSLASVILPAMTAPSVATSEPQPPVMVTAPAEPSLPVTPPIPAQPTITALQLPTAETPKAPAHTVHRAHAAKRTASHVVAKHARASAPAPEEPAAAAATPAPPPAPFRPQAQADDSERPPL